MSQTTTHIEFEKITDFVQGIIVESERKEIATHLASCPICAMQKKRLEQTISAMVSDKTESVPTYLTERVFDIFDVYSAPAKTEKTFVRERILAVLELDKLVPVFGFRSENEPEKRYIHFSVKDYLIRLQIVPTDFSEFQINGEIFGDGVIGGRVELVSKTEKCKSEIDDFSEFIFDGVKTGKYNLYIVLENYEISFPEFVVEN